MLSIVDIRKFIANLGIALDDNVYIGKLDSKNQKSIGVYNRKVDGKPTVTLGGYENGTYDTKPISLLVHWNKSVVETEKAAYELFEKLKRITSCTIGNTLVHFICLMTPEPQDVGTDDDGVYEYVIWLDLIYERKGE